MGSQKIVNQLNKTFRELIGVWNVVKKLDSPECDNADDMAKIKNRAQAIIAISHLILARSSIEDMNDDLHLEL